MKKNEKIYFVYIISILTLTTFFSVRIWKGKNNTQYKIIELLNKPKIKKELNLSIEDCNPCEKIGNEGPNCPQFWIKHSKNPNLHKELKPNFEQIYDGTWICLPTTTVKINSFGFRDYEYSVKKPNNTYRVVTIGDSFTFGPGVELNETYPKILERLLNKNSNLNYEVLNLGVMGYDMREKFEFFRQKGLQFDPDLILVQYCTDDILLSAKKEKIGNKIINDYLKKII